MMRYLTFSLFLLMFFCVAVDALEPLSDKQLRGSSVPIEVSSDSLEAEDLLGRVRFLGNVIVKRADFSLYAPEVEVSYLKGSRDIDRIEARGGVRIVQGERVLTSDTALYFHLEEKVLLKGGARVFRSGDFVEGDDITVFMREEKSIVTGSGDTRVNAVFQPKEQTP